jgi:SPP1 family phage portal protein
MESAELQNLIVPIQTGGVDGSTVGYNVSAYIEAIQKQWKPLFELKAYLEFDVDFHKIVKDRVERKDREVFLPTGVTTIVNGVTKTEMEKQIVKVARLPVPYQQLIVNSAVQFLTGGKLTLKCDPQNDVETLMFDQIKYIWKSNKLKFKNAKIAKAMMAQLECCELWYTDFDKKGEKELKVKILTPVDGFTFYPVFDTLDDLLAFGIHWKDKFNVEHFDLYTDEEKRSHIKVKGEGWGLMNNDDGTPAIVQHGYGKIPIIYYTQLKAEWHPVQRLIERYEFLISNFADINDYNGSPILFTKGKNLTLPAKGQAGKVIENPDGTGDAKYITWDQAPEAIKLEKDTLEKLINLMTQTAPLDFESLKGLGDISGAAFDRIMIAPNLKAKQKLNEDYGEGQQRRNNFLVSASASLDSSLTEAEDLEVIVDQEIFKIDSQADYISLLVQANGGKAVISQETSVELSGLVTDPEQEYEKIKQENDVLGQFASGGI